MVLQRGDDRDDGGALAPRGLHPSGPVQVDMEEDSVFQEEEGEDSLWNWFFLVEWWILD